MTDLLLNAWATTMWKACWQGGLVVLAVWLICQVIPSMPARCRCWLWRLAILKFMVVLLLPTLVNLPLLPAPPVASPMPDVAVQAVTQQLQVVPIDHVEFRPSRAVELPSISAILACLWIIGVGLFLARLLVAWQRARRLRKQSRIIDNMPLIEQLALQARVYGLRSSPRLLEIEGDGSPMLVGILRPAIVIPGGTLRKLSPSELAMVLGHELAHFRRNDLLWGLAAAVVRALFFFHPLVWLSQRRLNLAQEVAADELAILRQHHDPVSYGKLLVSVISKIGPSRLIPIMSMGTAGSVKSLTRRLVAMANIGRASRGIIVTSGILLAATVLLGVVPWRLIAAEPKVPVNQTEPPKVALPAYRIEPPDVISIEMLKLIPLPPYRAEVFDVLQIRANAPTDAPIDNYYMIEAEGTVNLGPQYGSVRVAGMTIDEIRTTLDKWLRQTLVDPSPSVQLARVSGAQPVTGQYLVGPDGTINLRQYGVVPIAGKTVTEARVALENHLKQFLDSPQVAVEVLAYNSKVYYVITQGAVPKGAAEPNAFVNIGVGSDGHEVGVPIAEVRKYAKEHGVSEKEAGKKILREMVEAEKKWKGDAGQTVPKVETEDAWGDISVSWNGGHIVLSKESSKASSFQCTGGVTMEGKGFTARATELQYDAEKNLLTLSGGKTDCTLYTKGNDGTISRVTAEKIVLSPYSSTTQFDDRSFRAKGVLIKAVNSHSEIIETGP